VSTRIKNSRRGFPRRLFLFYARFSQHVARIGEATSGTIFNAHAFRHTWQDGRMSKLFRFPSAARRDPGVEAWFAKPDDGLQQLALPWFDEMRRCGPDVRELLHDGHPTACAGDAAFGYVDAFRAHANVGFFFGTELDDPAGLLEGTGKRMRHVKLRPGQEVNGAALAELISAAYRDIRSRLGSLP
jgi:hypothetical protein